MKSVILALALGVASATSPAFEAWKAEHGMTYESDEQNEYRFGIWMSNKALVDAHNAEYARGRETYTLAMNQFAAMTNGEFQAAYLRPRASKRTGALDARALNGSVPDAYDWRDEKNVVTPVKNQGQCGSCWAFSAVAAMEGAYNYKSGSLNAFSEQELVDCVKNGHYTCNIGGEMSDGIAYVAKDMNGYIYTEEAYPYTGTSCSVLQNCCEAKAGEGVDTGITGFTAVKSGDEDALKTATGTYPIISVGIDASGASFQLYSSGVYAPRSCSSTQLDHGVAVVGYDTMANGGDYWIVKNSWGLTWGERGYIYMARNDGNKCGIATDACYANI